MFPTQMPDLCLETFGLAEKGISRTTNFGHCFDYQYYLTLGPEWDGQCIKDRRSRVLPVKFGETDSNSPEYCIKKCKSHEYSYAGVEYANVSIPVEIEDIEDIGDFDLQRQGVLLREHSAYRGGRDQGERLQPEVPWRLLQDLWGQLEDERLRNR